MDFSGTRLSFGRPVTSYSKVRAVLGPVLRALPSRPKLSDGALLNLGCGPHAHPDFFNIDGDFHEGVDLFCDFLKPLPLPDGCAAGAYSEHCLEHFSADDGAALLGELFRVLQSGAPLRIVVPDAGLYLRGYAQGQDIPIAHADRARLGDGYTPLASVNRIFYESGHRCMYDAQALSMALRAAGFVDVAPCGFRTGRDPRLLIDQEDRRPESLYMEATRP